MGSLPEPDGEFIGGMTLLAPFRGARMFLQRGRPRKFSRLSSQLFILALKRGLRGLVAFERYVAERRRPVPAGQLED